MTPDTTLLRPTSKADLDAVAARWRAGQDTKKHQLLVCAGAGCVSSGCHAVKHALLAALKDAGLDKDTAVHETGCLGSCHLGPTLVVQPDGVLYTELKPEHMKGIVKQHLVHHEVVEAHCWVDPETNEPVPLLSDIEFFRRQTRLVTARCGSTPYASIEAYIGSEGYQALAKVLAGMTREQVIQEMRASGLRGRGGGGFPVGAKWQAGYKAKGAEKIVVCNADEGDPGAFMDRSLLEGDPHAILEGMLVAGYAIGASQGYVYVRAEYPLAVERLEVAIRQAREWGLLGPNVMGTPFAFDVEIRIGAGAFVCGEETALMHSVEGKRGEPSQKPPFPFERGIFGKPTIINNVETLANVPVIIRNGGAWFASLGTPKSHLGTIMGSGGLIVMDEDSCMVDVARFFLDFVQDESCGKCVPCRIGTKRMLEILTRITKGQGKEGDIALLEELAATCRETSTCGLGQTAGNPVLSTIRLFREEYEEHIRDKYCRAGVCSDLFKSPCQNACPAGVDVPGYLALIAAGRPRDAYYLVRRENPFPAICGRVCTHPCESKCRRAQLDEPVAICDLKRYAADYVFANDEPHRDLVFPKKAESVGVIGAGPSGLTCAYYLARLGYGVTVYESLPVAGGMLASGIPEYRLPKEVLAKETRLVEQVGVKIQTGVEVGKDVKFEELQERHQAIYVATGTQFPNRAEIPGEDKAGIFHGVSFLREANLGRKVEIGMNVVVIGGGSTAFDAARTVLRLGAQKVTVLYRRQVEDMPADPREIAEAREEGIEILPLVAPVEFLGNGSVTGVKCVRMELKGFDDGGRRKPRTVPGSEFVVEADMVIPAISQHSDLPFIDRDEVQLTKWGTLVVDKNTMMTRKRGVFSGGDVVRGPDVAIQAIADGKRAASSIDLYLGGTGVLNKGDEIPIPRPTDESDVAEHERFPMRFLDPDNRKKGFQEVAAGFHKLNAIAEAMRCLRCDRR